MRKSKTRSRYLRSSPRRDTRTPCGMLPPPSATFVSSSSLRGSQKAQPSFHFEPRRHRHGRSRTKARKKKPYNERVEQREEMGERSEEKAEEEEREEREGIGRERNGTKEALWHRFASVYLRPYFRPSFTRQWFQPRTDKNYSNDWSRCKFHPGIPLPPRVRRESHLPRERARALWEEPGGCSRFLHTI